MTNKKIYIIHGFGATPEDHWFPWLAEKINELPIQQATTLQMPNPNQPDPDQWLAKLAQEIPVLDENTYLVAHSLGCITTLIYLSQIFHQDTNVQIGGLLLVSGFSTKLPELPLLDSFTKKGVDFQAIKQLTHGNITVLASANDSIVPTELTDQLAQELDADYYRKKENGHFLAEDGYIEFPLILTLLKNLIKQKIHQGS
ncbi:RBBP9/YdeN family alpha/beta hydrolase [Paenibacillus nasutitermitis]|uniref:Hydrolase YdeN n=1 Tax=Paenibacillus nasutitermitis TaxID=1652958 RepID=A0A917DXN1_9BACL|nr:alpha/beta hydrolase [Paenibacillus nasutitermitis]GGD77388.1 putative hydrolase YdeN [Paenibacillus nasutitermitis]